MLITIAKALLSPQYFFMSVKWPETIEFKDSCFPQLALMDDLRASSEDRSRLQCKHHRLESTDLSLILTHPPTGSVISAKGLSIPEPSIPSFARQRYQLNFTMLESLDELPHAWRGVWTTVDKKYIVTPSVYPGACISPYHYIILSLHSLFFSQCHNKEHLLTFFAINNLSKFLLVTKFLSQKYSLYLQSAYYVIGTVIHYLYQFI